jgi:hypothetical protein
VTWQGGRLCMLRVVCGRLTVAAQSTLSCSVKPTSTKEAEGICCRCMWPPHVATVMPSTASWLLDQVSLLSLSLTLTHSLTHTHLSFTLSLDSFCDAELLATDENGLNSLLLCCGAGVFATRSLKHRNAKKSLGVFNWNGNRQEEVLLLSAPISPFHCSSFLAAFLLGVHDMIDRIRMTKTCLKGVCSHILREMRLKTQVKGRGG